jgi:hypothetical protein
MNIDFENDRDILARLGDAPIAYGALCGLFADYKLPAQKISRLCAQGLLIRLKKGVYIVSPKITKKPAPYLLASNHLYGPSYVSFHTALGYYGMIPESVHICMAASPRRPKRFETPIGDYEYHAVPETYFHIGVDFGTDSAGRGFLVASREKAVCDLITLTNNLRIRSSRSMWEYLTVHIRMDAEAVMDLDVGVIETCAESGRKKEMLRFFAKAVKDAK